MADNIPSATRAVVKTLMSTIKGRMPSIVKAYDDFPAANQKLEFPSFSIFTKSPRFNAFAASVVGVLEKITDEEDPNFGKSPVNYFIGEYEFKLQLDFWCESKFQRHDIFEEFVQAMNALAPTAGISIQLTDYYGEWIHAVFSNPTFDNDTEVSSQRAEWRLKADVTVNMRCIKQKMENLMEKIEQTVEPTESGPVENPSDEEP